MHATPLRYRSGAEVHGGSPEVHYAPQESQQQPVQVGWRTMTPDRRWMASPYGPEGTTPWDSRAHAPPPALLGYTCCISAAGATLRRPQGNIMCEGAESPATRTEDVVMPSSTQSTPRVRAPGKWPRGPLTLSQYSLGRGWTNRQGKHRLAA